MKNIHSNVKYAVITLVAIAAISSFCYLFLADDVDDIVDIAPAPVIQTSSPAEQSSVNANVDISGTVSLDFQSLAGEVAAIAKANNVTGCSLAVFEGENILYTTSWGIASQRGGVKTSASDNTKYRVASISKMVTCVLTMSLVDQGTLRLDDELVGLIDPRLYDPNWPDDKPTLFHLLTHTSGIVDGSVYINAISKTPYPSLETLLEQGIPFSGNKPGSAYAYSNFGLGLVAAAIENASDKRFHIYANETLFEPMNLDAGFLIDYISDRDTIAQLDDVDPVSWGSMLQCYNNIPQGQMYLLAQGELYISAPDLARVTMLLAGDGTYHGRRYLSQESLTLIHQPYIRDDAANTTRGLTVQINDDIVDGVTLYGHQGNAFGVISCVFYNRETRRGVVFLTNNSSSARAENQVYLVNNEIIKAVWKYFA